MPQIIAFNNTGNNKQVFNMDLVSGQYALLNLPNDGLEYRFDIAPNASADPILELVPLDNRTIPLRPEIMGIIPEGSTYKMDVWDITDFDFPQRVASGNVVMAASILTLSLDYTTQFSENGEVVYLTQAEYDQRVSDGEIDEGTTYKTTEGNS